MDETSRNEAETDAGAPPSYMRAVRISIVVMGILLVAGFLYVGLEVYRRATDPDYRARAEANRILGSGTNVSASDIRRGETALLLPPGATIAATVPVGNRLSVTVTMADGTQVLYFINPSQNELVEFLRTQPAP